MNKRLVSLVIAISLLFSTITGYSHSGRTDSSGGHKDNKNKSGLGYYHYHCGGYPAHLHDNGVCPYKTTKLKNTSENSTSTTSASKSDIKAIQTKLNDLGYDCGAPDGVMGNKTKAAIKKFQKDNGLTADGVAGTKTKKALGI